MLDELAIERARRDRDRHVLKPANLTRGTGVVRGRDHTDAEWEGILTNAIESSGSYVVQEACSMRNVSIDGTPCNGDLSAYVVDGELVGFMGRVSLEPVVNIGRNGFLQTVWGRP